MITNIVQRSIKNQIRIPDALIPIYTPFMLNYSLSPSRLLSVMDPLLNLGILWRCLAAYVGIDFKLETEKFKTLLNLNDKTLSNKSSPSKSHSLSKSLSLRALLSRSTSSSNDAQPIGSETSSIRNSPNRDSSRSPDLNYISSCSSDDEKRNSSSDTDLYKNLYLDETNRKRLLHLHRVLGDSVFLVEKLREHSLTTNEFMSPLLSDDSVLSQFPRTFLIVSKIFNF
jgi:hypothetical protein